ncbi:hypothetical protein CUZ56_01718 [Saezia sanguinis]|uniref:DUF6396 domain-containing protein n=1 Tax=Saezia sanguinis TaxID=1965230 RepID=A0A433SCI7_9BURK|nr:DUF6396 domain-containing protein [Saezia sanguinis]RUS66439.1 hypothetical protein CUZ56_01718 [Saezia sanguinis]
MTSLSTPITRIRQRLCCLLLAAALAAIAVAVHAAPSDSPHDPQKVDSVMAQNSIKDYTRQEIEQLYGAVKPFDADRSAQELLSSCARWEPPVADPQARRWYRGATTLNAIAYRTIEQHQQMLILYEAAARKGHYQAVKNLTILYSESSLVRGGRFPAEPEKARAWLHYGLEQRWVGALEWLSTALHEGSAGYVANGQLSLMYLQKAADLGDPLAQYQVALIYGNRYKQVEKEEALLQCAAAQVFSAALHDWGSYNQIDRRVQQALELYQQAVMAGGSKGGDSAYVLSSAFANSNTRNQRELSTFADPIRKQAYAELKEALEANDFLRFPRLNEVLPLPPAKVPPWKGIYSAMSPDDAAYYQNPTPAQELIEDVRRAGLLVSDSYLSQPQRSN